jgi:hypothetical protein
MVRLESRLRDIKGITDAGRAAWSDKLERARLERNWSRHRPSGALNQPERCGCREL